MFLITIIIVIIIIVVSISLACERDFYLDVRGLWFTFLLLNFVLLILILIQMQKPTAMDVYKGKTTLEITYKDGTPIDSVVVWKDVKKY